MNIEDKKTEIQNFIIYFTSDEKEREEMYRSLEEYLEYEEEGMD